MRRGVDRMRSGQINRLLVHWPENAVPGGSVLVSPGQVIWRDHAVDVIPATSLHERRPATHGSVPWRRQAHHRLWPPRQTAVHCGPVALVSIVAARLRASMALEDVGAHRPAPGAWCASARAGSTTLDAGHGHEARLLRRSQQKLDSRLTGMCTDAADVIAATNTEIVPPARASSVPAPVRQATVYRRLAPG